MGVDRRRALRAVLPGWIGDHHGGSRPERTAAPFRVASRGALPGIGSYRAAAPVSDAGPVDGDCCVGGLDHAGPGVHRCTHGGPAALQCRGSI